MKIMHDGVQVTYTSGRQAPVIDVPHNACDCHNHIYDPLRFPYASADTRNQPPATVPMLRLLQKRLGLTRSVIVTPSAYGLDNACTLDALEQLGETSRGVAVVDGTVGDAELESMHAKGVRGIRFNIATGGSDDETMIRTLAHRIAEFGWHVQFNIAGERVRTMKNFLASLPSTVILDHFAHIPQPQGPDHPAFKAVCDLVNTGKVWVKLSGFYFDYPEGHPDYAPVVRTGVAFVSHAPERLVWGTDWPHPTVFSRRLPWPDEAAEMDLLAVMAPDAAVRNRILVDNPARLYDFHLNT